MHAQDEDTSNEDCAREDARTSSCTQGLGITGHKKREVSVTSSITPAEITPCSDTSPDKGQ